MKISVIPFYNGDLNNEFFDESKTYNFPHYLKKYFEERENIVNTVDITSIEDADYVIFFNLNLKYIFQAYFSNKLNKSIYIPFEPPVVDLLHKPENLNWICKLFSRVLTWQDSLIDNKNFFKFYFPMYSQTFLYKKVEFKDKLLLTTIVGYKKSNQLNELYSKRIEAIRYFEKKYNNFEFFGVGWNKKEFNSYQGKVDNKYEILKKYKFTLCYENECNIDGLVSEKIFDCFYARSIPIYWGASNIKKYFSEDTFIDKRNFKTYDDLNIYLINMTENEYYHRIEQIEKYLESKEFAKYSSENFAKNIYKQLIIKESNQSTLISILRLILKKIEVYSFKLLNKIWK